jgi:Methyltransferase domain
MSRLPAQGRCYGDPGLETTKETFVTASSSTTKAGEADLILGELIDAEEVIDRYDGSYVADLPHILREVHGVTQENAREATLWPELARLWALTGRPESDFSLDTLPGLLVDEVGVDESHWSPKQVDDAAREQLGYYGRLKHRRLRKSIGVRLQALQDRGRTRRDAREQVNTLQKELSLQSGGKAKQVRFDDLARPETGDPWSPLLIRLREEGVIGEHEPALTIGPRWVGEIHYFRETLGLKGTIGLDLFTTDDELVKVGDMHDMPFADDTFGLVYQRNTFNKSYDIRAALRESVRVLRDGGVLISDDCYAYTSGVSELCRTNLKHNRQVVRVVGDNVGEILYDVEADAEVDWIERVGQIAVRIKKG